MMKKNFVGFNVSADLHLTTCISFHLADTAFIAKSAAQKIQVEVNDSIIAEVCWDEEKKVLLCRPGLVELESHLLRFAFLAVLNFVFSRYTILEQINIQGLSASQLMFLRHAGLLYLQDEMSICSREQYVQQADIWLKPIAVPLYPQQYVITEGRRHPRRRPNPVGIVYSRDIAALNQRFTLRAASLDDVPNLHRWMNNSRVAEAWAESGPVEHQYAFLEKAIADPHTQPLIGAFDEKPLGYFEVYWAKEDRIAPFYDADDYDRGLHVLIGEEKFRGPHYVLAWLSSLTHYAMLDDARTRRIMAEPRADNLKIISYAERLGFGRVKEFDFPHKRACLLMLWRETFFQKKII